MQLSLFDAGSDKGYPSKRRDSLYPNSDAKVVRGTVNERIGLFVLHLSRGDLNDPSETEFPGVAGSPVLADGRPACRISSRCHRTHRYTSGNANLRMDRVHALGKRRRIDQHRSHPRSLLVAEHRECLITFAPRTGSMIILFRINPRTSEKKARAARRASPRCDGQSKRSVDNAATNTVFVRFDTFLIFFPTYRAPPLRVPSYGALRDSIRGVQLSSLYRVNKFVFVKDTLREVAY